MTRLVTCSLTVSLDGYTTDPDGSLDWGAPDPELFAFATEEVRGLGVHLLGTRLHETMRYWETVDPATLDEAETTFADLWNALPKVVFSSTLPSVSGSARLATADLATEIAQLRAAPEPGNIGIGGPTLTHAAAALGLVDEYRLRVAPVLLGGGTPFFDHDARRVGLELVETRAFACGVVFLRYRVLHPDARAVSSPAS